jgi:hypothetical protein
MDWVKEHRHEVGPAKRHFSRMRTQPRIGQIKVVQSTQEGAFPAAGADDDNNFATRGCLDVYATKYVVNAKGLVDGLRFDHPLRARITWHHAAALLR